MESTGEVVLALIVGAAWLAPSIVCFRKGKVGLGLLGLLGPVAATVLAAVVAVAYFLVFEDGSATSGWEDVGVLLYAAIFGILVWLATVAGALAASLVGAIRLAKPTSGWARRYESSKRARAEARFG